MCYHNCVFFYYFYLNQNNVIYTNYQYKTKINNKSRKKNKKPIRKKSIKNQICYKSNIENNIENNHQISVGNKNNNLNNVNSIHQIKKIIICEEKGFFDYKVMEQIAGTHLTQQLTDQQIQEEVYAIINRFNNAGITVRIIVEKNKIYIYYKAPKFILHRGGNNPFSADKDLINRFNQIQMYKTIMNKYFGNVNYGNIDALRSNYRHASHRKITHHFLDQKHKRASIFVEEKIPISNIQFLKIGNTLGLPDDKVLLNNVPNVKKYNFLTKLISYFYDLPCFVTNQNNADIIALTDYLKGIGYIYCKVYKKILFKINDINCSKKANIIYVLDLQKKYKINNIILHSVFLSNQEKLKIKNFINIFIKYDLSSFSVDSLNKILQNIDYQCQKIEFVQTKNHLVTAHIWVECHFYKDIVENIYFKNYEMNSLLHWPMLFNIAIGGPLEEENLQKFIIFLKKYSGTQPNFTQQMENGRLLIFDRGPRPEVKQWMKEILRLQAGQILLSPVKFKWFSIQRKPFCFAIEPFLNIPLSLGSFAKNAYASQLKLDLNVNYLTKKNIELSTSLVFGLNLGATKDCLLEIDKYSWKKAGSIEFDIAAEFFKNLPIIGMFDIKAGYQYCHSKYYQARNIDEDLSQDDKNKARKLEKEPIASVNCLELVLKKFILNSKRRKIFIKFDPKIFLQGLKLDGCIGKILGQYTAQIDDFYIFTTVTGGISHSAAKINGCLFSKSDFRIACCHKDTDYILSGALFRVILAHELLDSSVFIGMKIASLFIGLIFNCGLINRLPYDKSATCPTDLLLGGGIIFMFDFFGVIALFIACGISIDQKNNINIGVIDWGVLQQTNSCEAERLSNSTVFSA